MTSQGGASRPATGRPAESPTEEGAAKAGPLAMTEERNPRTLSIDEVPTLEVLYLLNAEDSLVPAAVAAVLPQLAQLVDAALPRLNSGGRLHYFGAGTSGRIAMLDAAELPPTFGVAADFATAHIAGGDPAIRSTVEDAEDDREAGRAAAGPVGPEDVAIGVSASGSAPYVAAAMTAARQRGALTALVSSRPGCALGDQLDFHLAVDTGPEALTGSTRLKAGSAAKLVLNGFSTAIMVRLGHCYSNVMVDVVPSNHKLRERLVRMLVQVTGSEEAHCRQALVSADGDVKVALVSMLSGAGPRPARDALAQVGGQVRQALAGLEAGPTGGATRRPSN